jgi:hypothetical protein
MPSIRYYINQRRTCKAERCGSIRVLRQHMSTTKVKGAVRGHHPRSCGCVGYGRIGVVDGEVALCADAMRIQGEDEEADEEMEDHGESTTPSIPKSVGSCSRSTGLCKELDTRQLLL